MERLREHDLHLLAPFSLRSKEKHRWPTELKHKRYRIETVISQLSNVSKPSESGPKTSGISALDGFVEYSVILLLSIFVSRTGSRHSVLPTC